MRVDEATKLQQRIFKDCATMLRHWQDHHYYEQAEYPPYDTKIDYDKMSITFIPNSRLAKNQAFTELMKAAAELKSIVKEESKSGLFKFSLQAQVLNDFLTYTFIFEK